VQETGREEVAAEASHLKGDIPLALNGLSMPCID
jgi:hypothetical protein